jgi:hypothetical protein
MRGLTLRRARPRRERVREIGNCHRKLSPEIRKLSPETDRPPDRGSRAALAGALGRSGRRRRSVLFVPSWFGVEPDAIERRKPFWQHQRIEGQQPRCGGPFGILVQQAQIGGDGMRELQVTPEDEDRRE